MPTIEPGDLAIVQPELAGEIDHRDAPDQQEFIRFLNTIEAQVPKRMAIHAIVDNYATHKHPKVREWLARHRRWSFHFTPTSASWLSAVEGFFAKLTRRRLKRKCRSNTLHLDGRPKPRPRRCQPR